MLVGEMREQKILMVEMEINRITNLLPSHFTPEEKQEVTSLLLQLAHIYLEQK